MKSSEKLVFAKTIDEIVASMINMGYIPSGVSLLEMTDGYLYVAEEDYERAQREGASFNQQEALRLRMEACRSRHELAKTLIAQLTYEIENHAELKMENPDDFTIDIESNSPPLICYISTIDWASVKLGINMPQLQSTKEKAAWEDVTIKIYRDYRIGYKIKDGKFKNSSFRRINLMGKNKNEPNQLGVILIGLSDGRKFPVGKKPEQKDKTANSKLRNALMKLTGLKDDPFCPINDADGWKPRFKLVDDRRNADERAKNKAFYVSLDENKDYSQGQPADFEREDDETQEWLDKKKMSHYRKPCK